MLYSTSIGLDVHARSISAAAFVFETGEAVQRTFGYDPDAVAAWAASLPQQLLERFTKLMPLYRFLLEVHEEVKSELLLEEQQEKIWNMESL